MYKIISLITGWMLYSGVMAQFPVLDWQKCLGGSRGDFITAFLPMPDGNMVAGGYTYSRDGNISYHHDTIGLYADIWIAMLDSNGNVLWDKSLGGSKDDILGSMMLTPDGGFLLAGNSRSMDGDVEGNKDTTGVTYDAWIVKLNGSGAMLWGKTLGGSQNDFISSVALTHDSNYIFTGYTSSHDGDVAFNHDTVNNTKDVWVFKTDASGTLIWERAYGGSSVMGEWADKIIPVFNQQFLISAASGSSDGDCHFFHDDFSPSPKTDTWMILINAIGDTIWERCFGGTGQEDLPIAIQLEDSSIVVTNRMWGSTNGDVVGNTADPFNGNIWTFCFSLSADSIVWQKVSGGPWADRPGGLFAKESGHITVATYSGQNGLDVNGNHGGWDFWLFELDSAQKYVWKQCFGGSSDEMSPLIFQHGEHSMMVAGNTTSNNGNISGNHGMSDFWISEVSILFANNTFVSDLWQGNSGIYPNPSHGRFFVKNQAQDLPVDISVYDLTGKLVFFRQIESPELFFPVDCSGLPSGFYVVRIASDGQFFTGKVMIE